MRVALALCLALTFAVVLAGTGSNKTSTAKPAKTSVTSGGPTKHHHHHHKPAAPTVVPVLTPQEANAQTQAASTDFETMKTAYRAAKENAKSARNAHSVQHGATNRAFSARKGAHLKYTTARRNRNAAQADVNNARLALFKFARTTFSAAKAALDAMNLDKPKKDALAAQRAQATSDLPHFPDPAKKVADDSLNNIQRDLDRWYSQYRSTSSKYSSALGQVTVLRTAVKQAEGVYQTKLTAEDQAYNAFTAAKKAHEGEQQKLSLTRRAKKTAIANALSAKLALMRSAHRYKTALKARLVSYSAELGRANTKQSEAEMDMNNRKSKRNAQSTTVTQRRDKISRLTARIAKADADIKTAVGAHALAEQQETQAKQKTAAAKSHLQRVQDSWAEFKKTNPKPIA